MSGWWVGRDLVVASVDRRCGAWRDGVCVATLAPVADNALGAVTAVASGGHMRWVVGDSRGRVALIEDGALLWRADAHAKSAVLAVQFDGKTWRAALLRPRREAGDVRSRRRRAPPRINTTAPRFCVRRV